MTDKTQKTQLINCVRSVFQVTGVFSKEYIPQGTRFGPLQGEIYTKDNVPKQANRKYFWRVSRPYKYTQIPTGGFYTQESTV